MVPYHAGLNETGALKVSESQWVKQGATFSHKNACKEFGLTEGEVIAAIKMGKLQYRQNYAHGNPYFRLLRTEVESLAQELHGTKGVEEQEVKHKLQKITKEINSLRRKLSSLEKQKRELIEIQKQATALP
ncbi:MAG: hypothetical protein ABID54_04655 [Pseudomonadota bacterium]